MTVSAPKNGVLSKLQFLLSPKLIYFFTFAYIRSIILYRCQFFRAVYHMSTSEFGKIVAVYSFVQFIAMPGWAYLVDRFKKPKLFVLSLSILSTISFMLFKIVPPRQHKDEMTPFWLLLLVSILVNGFACILIPLSDEICLRIIAKTEGATKEMYGHQRLFGCFGDIVGTYVISALVENQRYDNLFWNVIGFEILFLGIGLYCIPKDEPRPKILQASLETGTGKEKSKGSIDTKEDSIPKKKKIERMKATFGNLPRLFTPSFTFFLIIALLTGICKAFGANFLANYQEDPHTGLSASKMQIWITSTVGNLFEVIFFFLSKFMLEKFGSFTLLIGSQVAMIGRFTLYSILPVGTGEQWVIWMTILGESLKGMNLGLMQAAGVMIASREAPQDLQATAQGVFAGIYQGLAPTLSGIIVALVIQGEIPKNAKETDEEYNERRKQVVSSRNGFFDDNLGMFRIAAIFGIVSFLLLMAKIWMQKRKKDVPEKTSPPASNITSETASVISQTRIESSMAIENPSKGISRSSTLSSQVLENEVKEPEQAVVRN